MSDVPTANLYNEYYSIVEVANVRDHEENDKPSPDARGDFWGVT